MTTIATQPLIGAPPRSFRAATFLDAVRSEWVKARTVRSTMWTLLAAAVLGIGLGALISALAGNHYSTMSASDKALWDPTSVSGAGLALAQLAIGVLGIMLISGEYSNGAIALSLSAVPRRGRFLAAKVVVVAGITLVVGEVMSFVSFLIGQMLMSGHAPTASLSQPTVLRAVIGSGLYLALVGMTGLALGAILRHAAGSIAVLVAILFVLPGVAAALPASIEHNVQKFWPTQAGSQITTVVPTAHTLTPWSGFGIMCLFVAVLIGVAFSLLSRRDA
jgi:ABC-2 type transport system permease protein